MACQQISSTLEYSGTTIVVAGFACDCHRDENVAAIDCEPNSNGRAPFYITNPLDKPLHLLPVQRLVSNSLSSLAPLLSALLRKDRVAAQALLCQTRGEEAAHPCGHCENGNGVFEGCFTLLNKFNNRCANCVFSKLRDCTLHTRHDIDADDDYEPPSGSMSVGRGQQRGALMGQEQIGQDQIRRRRRRAQERRGRERRGQEQGQELMRQRQRPRRSELRGSGLRPADRPRQRQTPQAILGTAMCPIDLTEVDDV